MKLVRRVFAAVILLTGMSMALAQPVRIPGTLLEAGTERIVIKTPSGDTLSFKIVNALRVLVVAPTDAAQIKSGHFIAVTAAPQPDGTLLASRINIFPESMRGNGEGHRPMTGNNTMTNATVATVATVAAGGNTMTNATVGSIDAAAGVRRVTLQYKGGEKQALVPANVPMALLEQGDRTALTPGLPLIVNATRAADGSMSTSSVAIGKNGAAPPLY